MTRSMLLTLLVCLAASLPAQSPPAEGDLIPRSGTLMYMVSDRPDVLYRMFGTDSKGNWRLRVLANESLDKELAEAKPDEAKAARDVVDYIFNAYESLAQVEVGLVDVTMDGPKYLLHLKLKPGKKIDLRPEFLAEMIDREIEHRGVKYLLYRLNKDEPLPEDEGKPAPGEGGAQPMPPRRKKGAFGMDRYYVASVGESLLVSNFETTIRDAIDRWGETDRQESLSARAEFKQWRESRGKHDLSVFVIGREVQNLIERLLPSKEQAGLDAEMIYNTVDSWLQFREYRYVVFDFDYDEKARAATMAATLKTARPTRLLEKFAVEPGKFTALKYVPEGAVFTAGVQLGDAKKTFENLVELARDLQKVGRELEKLGAGMRRAPDMPPDMPPEGGTTPPDEPKGEPKPEAPKDVEPAPEGEGNPWLPRSVGPMNWLGVLLEAAQEEPPAPAPGERDFVEEFLKELDKALAEFGTTRDELLGVLGNQIVVSLGIDEEVAMKHYQGNLRDLMRGSNLGVVIMLKDVKKAQEIIARARENDPNGIFKGMFTREYKGAVLNLTPDREFGYAFTTDALLIAGCKRAEGDDPSAPIARRLQAMLDAGSATGAGRTSFTAEGSKFMEVDWGVIARVERRAAEASLRKLDRYARPPMSKNFNEHMTGFTVALRSREFKDGFEIALRVGGIPDLTALFGDAKGMFFEGASPDRDCYSYTEENLRNLREALSKQVQGGGKADLEALLAGKAIRAGTLQTPFDARWQGGRDKLGWVTLGTVTRDDEGKLPAWVDKDVAAIIEANEKAGFRSFKLAEGEVGKHLENYATGMIVAYQEKAETMGGHMLLYADGQVGWLHQDALKQALALNKEGKPVPAEDSWRGGEKPGPDGASPAEPQPKGEDNPWLPKD